MAAGPAKAPKVRLRPATGIEEAAAVVFGLTTEDDLLSYVRTTAHLTGWLFYHTTFSLKGPSGFPDVVCVQTDAPHRVIIAELKREGLWPTVGRISPRSGRWVRGQRDWLFSLQPSAVETYLWWPSDAKDIEQILTAGPRDDMACLARLRDWLARSG